jgi:hypothetical protein
MSASPLRLKSFGLAFAVVLLLASPSRADEHAPDQGLTPPPAAGSALTEDQLGAFGELVGEPGPVVRQRLQQDAILRPLAAAAADERVRRKHWGLVKTVVGFSIYGVGGVIGVLILRSSFHDCLYMDDTCDMVDGHRLLLGLAVLAASTGVGLGLGIPGIIDLARTSDAETAARERYEHPYLLGPPPSPRPPYSLAPAGHALKVPLFWFSF